MAATLPAKTEVTLSAFFGECAKLSDSTLYNYCRMLPVLKTHYPASKLTSIPKIRKFAMDIGCPLSLEFLTNKHTCVWPGVGLAVACLLYTSPSPRD